MFGTEIPSERTARQIGRAIIEQIQLRTESGRDVNGQKFEKYSKEYAEKKGVSRDSVDLLLTGSMLGNMQVVSSTKNTVTIGWRGQKNNNKAFNHNEGETVPRREFLGLTRSDETQVFQKFKDRLKNGESDS